MGACNSCQATAISTVPMIPRKSTAKLVLEDGRLQEFDSPVMVSEILQQGQAGGRSAGAFFVCDADGMGMEGLLSAMGAMEELRPGQLYFLLPLSMKRRPLQLQDMADLLSKASSALIKAASALPLVFPAGGVASASGPRRAAAVQRRFDCRRVRRGGSGWHSKLDLGAISENEDDEEEETEEGGEEEED